MPDHQAVLKPDADVAAMDHAHPVQGICWRPAARTENLLLSPSERSAVSIIIRLSGLASMPLGTPKTNYRGTGASMWFCRK